MRVWQTIAGVVRQITVKVAAGSATVNWLARS